MNLMEKLRRKNTFSGGLEAYQNTENAILLDVRTPEEYRSGHIAGSRNVPLDEIDRINSDKTQPLFLYCHSGRRSAQACTWLQRRGYTATNIGGISGYQGELER